MRKLRHFPAKESTPILAQHPPPDGVALLPCCVEQPFLPLITFFEGCKTIENHR